MVGGTKKNRRRPHINFEGVRYTSDALERKPELIGKKVRIYFNIQDIRQLHAFFEDGSELGILIASRSWRRTAHSLRLRKEILRLTRLGKLNFRDGDDAIEAWAVFKRRSAAKDKRSATALAKQGQVEAFASSASATAAAPPANDAPAGPVAEPNSAPAGTPNEDRAAEAVESVKSTTTPKPKPLSVRRTIVFGGNR